MLGEPFDLSEVAEELATFDKLHEEKDAQLVLKDELHVDEEGVINRAQNLLLPPNVLHHAIINHSVLPDHFHSILKLSLSILNKKDFAECTLTKQLLYLKVSQ